MPADPVESVIQHLLIRKLLRYRFAWFLFSLLGFYLAAVVVLTISAGQQRTISGLLATCRSSADSETGKATEVFTLQQAPGQTFALTPADFQPSLPGGMCQVGAFLTFRYETNVFHQPYAVDAVMFPHLDGKPALLETANGRAFPRTRQLDMILYGGGIVLFSALMLGVALCWRRVGPVARKSQRTLRRERREQRQPIPAAFAAQVREDLHWLAALPWARDPEPDFVAAYARFQRGMGYVRGWAGDERVLMRGVRLLVTCPIALAYTGAAAVALQLSAYDLTSFAPEGLDAARDYVERALAAAPGLLDARIGKVHVLAGLAALGDTDALEEAETLLRILRETGPAHPRLPAAAAHVHITRRQYSSAIASLRRALAVAPTQEEAAATLDLLAQTLLRAGNIKQAVRLFVLLNRTPGEAAAGRPSPRAMRSATSVPAARAAVRVAPATRRLQRISAPIRA
ncbi:MAG: hypothetical protein ACRDHP_19025 [Ktedonobacterales bacterium]